MRELTISDINHVAGGLDITLAAGAAFAGAAVSLLPANELIMTTVGMTGSIPTFVIKGIPFLLGQLYPTMIIGACVGVGIAVGIDYALS